MQGATSNDNLDALVRHALFDDACARYNNANLQQRFGNANRGPGSGSRPAPARPHSAWGAAPIGLTSPIAPNARIAAERTGRRAQAGRPATGKLSETGPLLQGT